MNKIVSLAIAFLKVHVCQIWSIFKVFLTFKWFGKKARLNVDSLFKQV